MKPQSTASHHFASLPGLAGMLVLVAFAITSIGSTGSAQSVATGAEKSAGAITSLSDSSVNATNSAQPGQTTIAQSTNQTATQTGKSGKPKRTKASKQQELAKQPEVENIALNCVEQTSTGDIVYLLRSSQGRAEVSASVNDNTVAQVRGCLAFRLGPTRLVQCLDKNSDMPRFTQYIVTADLNMHFIQTSVLDVKGEKSLQVSPLEGTAHCKEI